MAKPIAFLSSTYLDLRDVRDSVDKYLQERGFTVTRFERGGIFYDPNLPLYESCYREVKNAHLVILIIGGRYGSPESNSSTRGKRYTSVTRRELETAIEEGIPVLVFVRRDVDIELRTYLANSKKTREQVRYASVDDTQIFQLLEQIYQRRKGNPVFPYGEVSEIISALDSQLAGLIARALQERRGNSKTAKVMVNGFKLFYYREQMQFTQKALAEKADVPARLISRLERVDLSPKMTLGTHLFQSTNREALEKIECALCCEGKLATGQRDDFLSMFMHYYGIYKMSGKKRPNIRVGTQMCLFPIKTLVLDFDGTLTIRAHDDLTTWERLWVSVGYTVNDCSDLARRYVREGKVSPEDHKAWCAETCQKLRARGFTKEHLRREARTIKLVPDVHEVLSSLHAAGVGLFMTSGSVREIIREVMGHTYELFDEVHANSLVFDASERLIDIRGTRYDFEGKAEFIKGVIEKQNVSPLEVLFIGNSLNDIWASNAGAQTLCVNPHFTNPNDVKDWTYCIREMDTFERILPYLAREDFHNKIKG